MVLFDSHAHYDDERFDRDRDAVLKSLRAAGVESVCNIGSDLPSSRRSVALAEKYPFIRAVVGIHPHNAIDAVPQDYGELRGMLSNPRVVALGEIGLDYHYDLSPRITQIEVFARQMELARELSVPVVIHEREASRDCMDVVRQYPEVRGVFHCYSGSVETAHELIERGYYLGFTGVITFANARRPLEVLRSIPRDRILIETDCPYLTPVPHRGERNDSRMLRFTAAKAAEALGITPEELAAVTDENAKRFYRIGD